MINRIKKKLWIKEIENIVISQKNNEDVKTFIKISQYLSSMWMRFIIRKRTYEERFECTDADSKYTLCVEKKNGEYSNWLLLYDLEETIQVQTYITLFRFLLEKKHFFIEWKECTDSSQKKK